MKEKFWEEPGTFLTESIELGRKAPIELYRMIEKAPNFHAFIAVGILSRNPEAHHILQDGNGLYERLKDRFAKMSDKVRIRAQEIVQEYLGVSDAPDPTLKRQKTDDLKAGRKHIDSLRKLLGGAMATEAELESAWKLLRDRIEEIYGPKQGDPAPPPPKRKQLKEKKTPVKPSAKENLAEKRSPDQTSVLDYQEKPENARSSEEQ